MRILSIRQSKGPAGRIDHIKRSPNLELVAMNTAKYAFFSSMLALTSFGSLPVTAHEWYPKECCNDHDCVPVQSVERVVPAGGGDPYLVVKSARGYAVIRSNFPVRQSKDGRMHICIGHYDRDEFEPICFFAPPGM